jgi:hypothetical protein
LADGLAELAVSFLARPRTGSPGQLLPLATGSLLAIHSQASEAYDKGLCHADADPSLMKVPG